MRLKITLNMPSQGGSLVHQILCEYAGANNLADVADYLESHDFITVQQFYVDRTTRDLTVHGAVVLHRQVIGKIEIMEDR